MPRAGGKGRVEDDRNYTVDTEIEYTETCTPKGRVGLLALIGILVALLLLILAIVMILIDFDDNDGTRIVDNMTTTAPAGTMTTMPPAGTTTLTSPGPLSTTTLGPTTTTPIPCIDYEPELCDITWYEWLCDTKFGQSQCCWTCYVPEECRDIVEGCHKVLLYGLCDNPRFQQECCATCVYAEP